MQLLSERENTSTPSRIDHKGKNPYFFWGKSGVGLVTTESNVHSLYQFIAYIYLIYVPVTIDHIDISYIVAMQYVLYAG